MKGTKNKILSAAGQFFGSRFLRTANAKIGSCNIGLGFTAMETI